MLRQDAWNCYIAATHQLYDEWLGFYRVMELKNSRYVERHPGSRLSKKAALHWRNPDPARFSLEILWKIG